MRNPGLLWCVIAYPISEAETFGKHDTKQHLTENPKTIKSFILQKEFEKKKQKWKKIRNSDTTWPIEESLTQTLPEWLEKNLLASGQVKRKITTSVSSCVREKRRRLPPETQSVEPVLPRFLICSFSLIFPVSWDINASFDKLLNSFRPKRITSHIWRNWNWEHLLLLELWFLW